MKSNHHLFFSKLFAGGAAIIAIVLGVYLLQKYVPTSAPVPKSLSPAASATPPAVVAFRTSGKITVVGKDSITVAAPYYPGVPESALGTSTTQKIVIFSVDTQTIITKQVVRPREQFEAELAAYQKDPAHTPPPVPYTNAVLKLSDLVVGMGVTITPASAASAIAADILVVSSPVQ
mgnify:CR=1 FL=1